MIFEVPNHTHAFSIEKQPKASDLATASTYMGDRHHWHQFCEGDFATHINGGPDHPHVHSLIIDPTEEIQKTGPPVALTEQEWERHQAGNASWWKRAYQHWEELGRSHR